MARWAKVQRRGYVEDRRGMAFTAGGIGITGVVALLAVNFLLGGDLGDALRIIEEVPLSSVNMQEFEGEDEYEVFSSRVLGSTNTTWENEFKELSIVYTEPKLVLFRDATQGACGLSTSEVGPHYCPIDQTIYLDETFFDELEIRFGAKGGDVAEAYVIGHEVGHHVQNLLGIIDSNIITNETQIMIELMADCLAGVWANSLNIDQILLPGEIDEAMDAAAAVGDDRIQKKLSGQINPETWTHGSSEQRVAAFNLGYENGNLKACEF